MKEAYIIVSRVEEDICFALANKEEFEKFQDIDDDDEAIEFVDSLEHHYLSLSVLFRHIKDNNIQIIDVFDYEID